MSKLKYKDLTEAEFEHGRRDFHRDCYAQYLAFVEDRKKHKAAFEEAQQHRCAISRWYHAWLKKFRDRWDDDEEVDLLSDANPLACFALYKQQHSNKKTK